MFLKQEIPPTAGLPMLWRDWLPNDKDLCQVIANLFHLTPLQLECSGTAALIVALKTLISLRQNTQCVEVIIPAYNCPLVVLAIAYCGLKPIICDTKKNNFDFDPVALSKQVNANTLAIIPTHLGGQLADVAYCVKLAKNHNAYVIEDAAQALGANVGQSGDISFFSLAVGKGLTLFEGGLLTARKQEMRDALKKMHHEIMIKKPIFEFKRLLELLAYTAFYRPFWLRFFYGWPRRKALKNNKILDAVGDVFDINIPLHEVGRFRAKRGAHAAHRLNTFLCETQKNALTRIEQLSSIKGVQVVGDSTSKNNTWPFLMLLMPDKKQRDAVLQKLWASPYGVSRLFIFSLQSYDYLKPYLGEQATTPQADEFSDRMLTISNSPWLKTQDFNYICEVINKVVMNHEIIKNSSALTK